MSEAISQSIPCTIPTRPRDEGLIVGIVEVLRRRTRAIAVNRLWAVIQRSYTATEDEFLSGLKLLLRARAVERTPRDLLRISGDARRGMSA